VHYIPFVEGPQSFEGIITIKWIYLRKGWISKKWQTYAIEQVCSNKTENMGWIIESQYFLGPMGCISCQTNSY
jgi:hypothetical protein